MRWGWRFLCCRVVVVEGIEVGLSGGEREWCCGGENEVQEGRVW